MKNSSPANRNERPVLFSGPMVRAILAGVKTQTRRPVKPQPAGEWAAPGKTACPFGVPGDRLFVREAIFVLQDGDPLDQLQPFHYAADIDDERQVEDYRKVPSIHMPRWASRLTLEITGVRVERLQSISFADCRAEGCDPAYQSAAHECRLRDHFADDGSPICNGVHLGVRWEFVDRWEKIYPGSWAANPWVWVVEFKIVEKK